MAVYALNSMSNTPLFLLLEGMISGTLKFRTGEKIERRPHCYRCSDPKPADHETRR